MNVVTFFIAYSQPPVLVEPCQGSFDYPSRGSKTAAVWSVALGEDGSDALGPQCLSMRFGVIGAIGLKPFRTPPGLTAFAAHGWNGLHQRQQLRDIVGVGSGYREGKGDALAVGENVMFAPRFAPIGWIRPRFVPPKTARTEALSATARDQSMLSAPFNFANSVSKTSCQIPSFCQASRRRQQVMPLPQPISWGRYSHGRPVRKTYNMPVSVCRFGMAGRPRLLGGLFGGRSGSTSSQR